MLHEGVSEIALAALLDTAALNLTHSYTLAPERTFVRSRHGMIMAPRYSYDDAPALDRAIVLKDPADFGAESIAEQWNQLRGQPHIDLLTSGVGVGFAYDVVIADIAQYLGPAVARSDSINLVYPVDPAVVSGSAWTPLLLIHPLGVGLLGLTPIAILLARRNRTRLIGQSV